MRIIGIDPGYGILGYGVLEKNGSKIDVLGYGVIETAKKTPLQKRVKKLYDELTSILNKFKPDIAAIEKIFFTKSVTTALEVGHARGIVLLALEEFGIKAMEFPPQMVKMAVTGYGRSTKRQIQIMVKKLLNLTDIPKPDDAADALAIAWCGLLNLRGEASETEDKRIY